MGPGRPQEVFTLPAGWEAQILSDQKTHSLWDIMTGGKREKPAEMKEVVIDDLSGNQATGSDGVIRTLVGNRTAKVGESGIAIGNVLFVGSEPETQIVSPPKQEGYLELLIAVRDYGWWLVNTEGLHYIDLRSVIPGLSQGDLRSTQVRYGETFERLIVVVIQGGSSFPYVYVLKLARGESGGLIPTKSGAVAPVGDNLPVVDLELEETIDIYAVGPVDTDTRIIYDFACTMHYPVLSGSVEIKHIVTEFSKIFSDPFSASWFSDTYSAADAFKLVFDQDHIDQTKMLSVKTANMNGLVATSKRWDNYNIQLIDFAHRTVDGKNDILLFVTFIPTGPVDEFVMRPRKEALIDSEGFVEIFGSGGWRKLIPLAPSDPLRAFPPNYETKLEKLVPEELHVYFGGDGGRFAVIPMTFYMDPKLGVPTLQDATHVAVISTLKKEMLWKDSPDKTYSRHWSDIYEGWYEYNYARIISADKGTATNPDIIPYQILRSDTVNVYGKLDAIDPYDVWKNPDGSYNVSFPGPALYNWGFHFAISLGSTNHPPLIVGDIDTGSSFKDPEIRYTVALYAYDDSGIVGPPPSWPTRQTFWNSRLSGLGSFSPGENIWEQLVRSPYYIHDRILEKGAIENLGSKIVVGYNIVKVQARRIYPYYQSGGSSLFVEWGASAFSHARSSFLDKTLASSSDEETPTFDTPSWRMPLFSPDIGVFIRYEHSGSFKEYLFIDLVALEAGKEGAVFVPIPPQAEVIAPENIGADFLAPVFYVDSTGDNHLIYRDADGKLLLYLVDLEGKTLAETGDELSMPDSAVELQDEDNQRPLISSGTIRVRGAT